MTNSNNTSPDEFDWREYPNLIDTESENPRSANLFDEYSAKVIKEIARFTDDKDLDHFSSMFKAIAEYRHLATSDDRYDLEDWSQIKMMMGSGDPGGNKVGSILYLIPLHDDHIHEVTISSDLLLIYINIDPYAQIGIENPVSLEINTYLHSQTLQIDNTVVDEDKQTLTLNFTDSSNYFFDGLSDWEDALKLKIEAIIPKSFMD